MPFPARLFPNQRYHHALNLELTGRNQIRIARVFRLEIWPAALHDITFQCRFAVDQCRNDVAVVHVLGIFQNHNVAIDNVRPNHRIAADPQGERATIFLHVGGARVKRHVAFDSLLRQRRHACWNLTVDRNIGNPDLHHRRDQRASLVRMPIEKTFSLQRRDVLHYRGLAGESKVILDFTRAWRDPLLALLALDKIENSPLPLRQHA